IYSRSGMGAEEYGKCKRAHWGVENSLHWVLDIGFREDESRIRAGNAAENVNVSRHIGTNLLKQEKSCKMGIASKRKKCGYDPDYLYKVLGGLNTGLD
ncbi:MAG: ISAs1 family transposase, partial [Lachnospiraceae bacterium]|nr:ISAs1 family transposase [Lachnospiraceae bacterium]